jgi:hypothetical protein
VIPVPLDSIRSPELTEIETGAELRYKGANGETG